MGQCVCGQYYNPGDVQCRFCGRLLQDSAYPAGQAGYDQYPVYPKPAEYDTGYAQKPFIPETKPQQGYDMQQKPYAQGQPSAYQPSSAQQPPHVQQQQAAQAPRPAEPPKPMPKPVGAPRDIVISPDLVAAVRALKSRSLVQLIVVIAGFTLTVGTSVYLIMVLSAILKALSQ